MAVYLNFNYGGISNYGGKFKFKDGGNFKYGFVCEFTRW
jgi:hypothetical protein